MNEPLWVWGVVVATLVIFLLLDLFVLDRSPPEKRTRHALVLTLIWVLLAVLFGLGLVVFGGSANAEEYFSAYLLEKGLALDNVFVFYFLFSYFAIPPKYEHDVLFDVWGLALTLMSRIAVIAAGIALLRDFSWSIYILGFAILAIGLNMAHQRSFVVHPDRNLVLILVKRFIPMTETLRGNRFFVREQGALMATPLFAALIAIETAEVIFAVDSIPAVLGVTDKAFLVFTSNAFALLGLRAFYLVLAGLVKRYQYLHRGLAVVVILIGIKLMLEHTVEIAPWVSLTVVTSILLATILASVRAKPDSGEPALPPEQQVSLGEVPPG